MVCCASTSRRCSATMARRSRPKATMQPLACGSGRSLRRTAEYSSGRSSPSCTGWLTWRQRAVASAADCASRSRASTFWPAFGRDRLHPGSAQPGLRAAGAEFGVLRHHVDDGALVVEHQRDIAGRADQPGGGLGVELAESGLAGGGAWHQCGADGCRWVDERVEPGGRHAWAGAASAGGRPQPTGGRPRSAPRGRPGPWRRRRRESTIAGAA